jgi:hypothetical protein
LIFIEQDKTRICSRPTFDKITAYFMLMKHFGMGNKNKHEDKKVEQSQDRGNRDKNPVSA